MRKRVRCPLQGFLLSGVDNADNRSQEQHIYHGKWPLLCSPPRFAALIIVLFQSGVELASGALGIIESGISLVARLRAADQRRKELSLLSLSDHQELERMRDTIDLIQADDGLRSPIILSELDIFKAAVGSLVEVLGLIYQPQRNPTHELMHQLAHGPEDAEKIRRSMETVRQSHHRLSLRLQILHFKLTASCKGDTGREEAEGGRGVGDPDMKGKASVSGEFI